jgi:hypothetical protein
MKESAEKETSSFIGRYSTSMHGKLALFARGQRSIAEKKIMDVLYDKLKWMKQMQLLLVLSVICSTNVSFPRIS